MKQKYTVSSLIITFIRPCLIYFIASLIFFMINTLGNALIPQVVRFCVDGVLGANLEKIPSWLLNVISLEWMQQNVGLVLVVAAAMVIVIAMIDALGTYAARTTGAMASEIFVKGLRDALYEHIQRLPYSWHGSHQTGEIIQRCTSDVEVVRNFVTNQLLEVVRVVFLVVLYASIMFSMNVSMTWIALTFMPIVVSYSGYFFTKIAKQFLMCDEAEAELSSVVQENLTGVRVVRAFNREKFEQERFQKKNNRFADLWVRIGHFLSLYWSIGDLITGIQILVIIVAGTYFTVNEKISLGEFMAFISYNSSLIWPIRSLGRVISEMSKAKVSIERLTYILNAQIEEDAGTQTPDMRQDIHFEHVNFAFEKSMPVLKDISVTIPAGKVFGILGNTGSGKSTLMHLLNRLYELPSNCGNIRIGDTNIQDISLKYLRKNIGIVLQEPFLYSGTIRENIGVTAEKEDMLEIQKAAAIACVKDSIESFADGYETIVGERGVTLSGGQKQRVAIARMLMQKAPIMIFDDSLSAVDAQTDEKIRHALKETMANATIILISHRITTLMQASCIMVLEDGEITQMGTHEELLKQEGTYRKIYEIQMDKEMS
ncbi:MAG: ABC transporter ATP-binding protein [Lachnospiraceae bacterium]